MARERTDAARGFGRVERELVVRARILAEASPAQVAQLIAHERDVTFAPGQALITQGQPARRFYLVVDGEVAIDGLAERASVGVPIGVSDALLERPHLRTARAVGTVHAIALDVRDYFEFLEDNPDAALRVISQLAADLHDQLVALPAPDRLLGPPRADLVPASTHPDTLVERLPVLRHLRPFVRASIQAQVSLADDATPYLLRAGQRLFGAGDPADRVWMVAAGSVVLASDGAHPLRLPCGPGDLVEHHAALSAAPRRFTAVAATDALLLGLDREALHDRMEEHFDLVRSMLAHLVAEQERLVHARALLGIPEPRLAATPAPRPGAP